MLVHEMLYVHFVILALVLALSGICPETFLPSLRMISFWRKIPGKRE